MEVYGYIYSNLLFLGLIIAVFIIAVWFEGWTFRNIKIKQISSISILCAINVILTNFIGYSFSISSIHFSLALGQWLLFLCGLIFGSLCGVICSICSDLVGDIINIGGVFHFGFLFSSSLCALFGGLIFKFAKNYKYFWIGFVYIIFYVLKVFLINPICYYYIGFYDGVFINMLLTLIRAPFLIIFYLSLIYSTYPVLLKIVHLNSLAPVKETANEKEKI